PLKEMTKPWRNITTIWLDKKNCVFVFISVNLTGDSTERETTWITINQENQRELMNLKYLYFS
ncbi:hypothetical protein, partial [Limosilactobacillus fermentum]